MHNNPHVSAGDIIVVARMGHKVLKGRVVIVLDVYDNTAYHTISCRVLTPGYLAGQHIPDKYPNDYIGIYSDLDAYSLIKRRTNNESLFLYSRH